MTDQRQLSPDAIRSEAERAARREWQNRSRACGHYFVVNVDATRRRCRFRLGFDIPAGAGVEFQGYPSGSDALDRVVLQDKPPAPLFRKDQHGDAEVHLPCPGAV